MEVKKSLNKSYGKREEVKCLQTNETSGRKKDERRVKYSPRKNQKPSGVKWRWKQ